METQELKPQFERERSRESKESKEAEQSPEAQAAAAMERAELLVKEVQSNKKQMQNIVMHMGQVQQAIKAIRQQLQLAGTDDGTSTTHDQAQIDRLNAQIAKHQDELIKMKDDLIKTHAQELVAQGVPANEAQTQAQIAVETLIHQ